MLETLQNLNTKGGEPNGCISHGMSVSFDYADPDGVQREPRDGFGECAISPAAAALVVVHGTAAWAAIVTHGLRIAAE
ncbi:MAG: hypothetical protein ACXIT4_06355 [Erythrobacter sp.]